MGWLARRLRSGFRRRSGSAVLIAVLAAIVAIVAATTPILIRSVQQSALEHALSSVPVLERSVIGNASSGESIGSLTSRDRAAKVTAALGHATYWEPASTFREQNDTPLKWSAPKPAGGQPKQRLADIPSCSALRFVAGRCPRSDQEGAIAQSTFTRNGLHLGERITLASPLRRVSVTLVGVYDATTAVGTMEAHPSAIVEAPTTGLDPDLLLAPDGFSALMLPTTAFSLRTLRTDVPLDALPSVRAGIARARAIPLTASGAAASTNAVTSLDGLLDRIDSQRNVVSVILDVVAAGTVGLALLAFVAIAQRFGRVRSAEWAVPRLRGMSRRRRLGARLVEPLLALIGGAVVGSAASIAVAVTVVGPATRTSVIGTVPAALALDGVATLVGAAAIVAVGAAADRRPLDEQLRRATEPTHLSRAALVGQAVIVVAALASIVALLTTPGAVIGGAGVLAPVLIALAVGFVALQVALVLVRRGTRRVPSSLVGLIVWRRLSRSPSQLVSSVLVAAAVALGTFVTAVSVTADAWADATAQASVAAPTVLHVRTPGDLSLLAAVDGADPRGSTAMAAEELRAGDGTARVIAVDSARLEAVSTWRSSWAGSGAASLAHRLAPPVGPSLRLRGTRLTMAIDDIAPGTVDDGAEAFSVSVSVQSSNGVAQIPLGTFAPSGARRFTASVPCAEGCTLGTVSVRCIDQYPVPWSLHLVVTAMSTDAQPADHFQPALRRGSWISDSGHVLDPTLPFSSTVRPGPTGLALDLTDTIGSEQPGVRVRDTVEPLPVVLGAITTADRFPGAAGTILGTGIDGSAVLLRPVGRASALPRLLGDGVLVDLRRMLPQIDQGTTRADEQVWVSGDPTAIERRLRAQHVSITSTETLGAGERSNRAEAGPLSSRFALIGAAGALAVVLIALLGGRLLAVPARRRQWGSFAAAGVPLPRMRRLVAVEFLAPAAAAIVIGAVCGAVTVALALPHLPLADAAPEGPPAGLVPPWGLAAVFPAATLVAVLLMTVVVVRAETRGVEQGDGA